jgi:hypothetical protein
MVQFSRANYNFTEVGSTVPITVSLNNPSALTVTVNYSSTVLTATPGNDYLPTSGLLTFLPGITRQTFLVTLLEDSLDELDETVALALSGPTNAILGPNNNATLNILDNDNPPLVQLNGATFNVNEANTTVSIDVTLSAISSLTVTLDFATADQTATAGADYTSTSGSLTFTPGQTGPQTVIIPVNDDTLHEPDEAFTLALSNLVNTTPGSPDTAIITISANDDPGPGDPCRGNYPLGEPDIGAPDNVFVRIACDVGLIVGLGSTPLIADGDTNYDLVYYEIQPSSVPTPTLPNVIFMDSVLVEIGQTANGPWYPVFYWGDGINDTNSNIFPNYPDSGPSSDNTEMASPPLYEYPSVPAIPTGIQIDVDNSPLGSVPPGSYQYLRIYSPPIVGPPPPIPDGSEVDAIEILP